MSDPDRLPPLVLRCKPVWRLSIGVAAVTLTLVGTAGLARAFPGRAGDLPPVWVAGLILLVGVGCTWFVGRYCLSRLVLDEKGFGLVGPLVNHRVAWGSVVRWERRRPRGGPSTVRIVHGPDRRLLSIPLIYEDSHALEVGLAQRHFPQY